LFIPDETGSRQVTLLLMTRGERTIGAELYKKVDKYRAGYCL